ncbi:unnamed protein product [Laminaria digitata]
MGNQVAVQTEKIWAVGASSYISNGTYPEGSVIPIVVTFSVEVYVMYGVPSLSLNAGSGADGSDTNTTATNTTTNSSDASSNSTWVTDNNTTTTTTTTTTTSQANYTSGNGTLELLFTYTVEAGDVTDRLDYSAPSSSALSAPYGSIVAKDTLEPVYLRSLPEPGEEGSLGWSKDIVISNEVLLVERVSMLPLYTEI